MTDRFFDRLWRRQVRALDRLTELEADLHQDICTSRRDRADLSAQGIEALAQNERLYWAICAYLYYQHRRPDAPRAA